MVPRRKLLGDVFDFVELPCLEMRPIVSSSPVAALRDPASKERSAVIRASAANSLSIRQNTPNHMSTVVSDAGAERPRRKHRREEEVPIAYHDGCALKGLASIPVDEELFEGSLSAAVTSSGRRCFRPLWSLIGSFKTELHSLVDLDLHNDILKWYQRTPSGGLQHMRVPIASIVSVRVSSMPRSDEGTAHWVIVRTKTRPSQVVFGLKRLGEARQLRLALRGTDAN